MIAGVRLQSPSMIRSENEIRFRARRFPTASVIGIYLCLMAGCYARNLPDLVEVSGQITVDGLAIEGVSVAFCPDKDRGTSGPVSIGVTDTKGRYALFGPQSRPGAVCGFHKVTFSCPMKSSTPDGRRQENLQPCKLSQRLESPLTTDQLVEVRLGRNTINFRL